MSSQNADHHNDDFAIWVVEGVCAADCGCNLRKNLHT